MCAACQAHLEKVLRTRAHSLLTLAWTHLVIIRCLAQVTAWALAGSSLARLNDAVLEKLSFSNVFLVDFHVFKIPDRCFPLLGAGICDPQGWRLTLSQSVTSQSTMRAN